MDSKAFTSAPPPLSVGLFKAPGFSITLVLCCLFPLLRREKTMFTNDLYCEINLLQNIQKSHYEKLCSPNHPSGILLCQKHTNSYRWRKRDMQENRLITTSIYKSDQALAQNLAVNLYHIICIQNLQMQINSIDNLLRSRQTGNQHLELPDASAAQLPFYALFRGLRHHPLVPADFFDPHSPYRPFILSYLSFQ